MKMIIEIAETPRQHEEGLMFRRSLDEDSGMAFKFSSPKVLNFWGANTYIPLDIAFVSPENKIVKITNIKPMSENSVSSDTDCLIAIEANIDFFSANNICVGDEVLIGEDKEGNSVATFKKFEGN